MIRGVTRNKKWGGLILLLCVARVGDNLSAALDVTPSLIERNPFRVELKVESSPIQKYEGAPIVEDKISFLGSYKIGNERVFSLNFEDSGERKWLRLDEQYKDLKLLDYVENQRSLFVEIGGVNGMLKLARKNSGEKSMSLRNEQPQASGEPTFRRPSKPAPRKNITPPLVVPKRVARPKEVSRPEITLVGFP